jgi:hypothetical protein
MRWREFFSGILCARRACLCLAALALSAGAQEPVPGLGPDLPATPPPAVEQDVAFDEVTVPFP